VHEFGLKPVRAFLFCFTSLPNPGLFYLFVCERAQRIEKYSSDSFVGLNGSSKCDLKFGLGHCVAVAYASGMVSFQENRWRFSNLRQRWAVAPLMRKRQALSSFMPVPNRSRTRAAGTKRPMPLGIRPMMAQSSAEPFDNPEWLFEMKWDGYRALATIDSGNVSLWSRNGLRLDSKYPLIAQELKDLKLQSAILDGEIVELDADGIPRFGLLQRFQRDRDGTLMYLVFDLLYLNGEDLI
jgi:ATP-dependent DNA ligase